MSDAHMVASREAEIGERGIRSSCQARNAVLCEVLGKRLLGYYFDELARVKISRSLGNELVEKIRVYLRRSSLTLILPIHGERREGHIWWRLSEFD